MLFAPSCLPDAKTGPRETAYFAHCGGASNRFHRQRVAMFSAMSLLSTCTKHRENDAPWERTLRALTVSILIGIVGVAPFPGRGDEDCMFLAFGVVARFLGCGMRLGTFRFVLRAPLATIWSR